MDILSIIAEPGAPNGALASYRPIVWQVQADSAVSPDQPMYADVYFGYPPGGIPLVYYKTISSYTIDSLGGFGLYTFDIQDALQEYLTTFIPKFSNTVAIQQSDTPQSLSATWCIVYFRGSTISGSGILTPNPVVPTQGTATTAPISTFSGTPSSMFFIFNATLNANFENITDNDIQGYWAKHQVTDSPTYFLPSTQIYPLSNLPINAINIAANKLGDTSLASFNFRGRQGMFPIAILQFGNSGVLPTNVRNCSVWVGFSANGTGILSLIQLTIPQPLTVDTFYIPLGLLELSLLMPPINYNSLIDPSNNNYYRIMLYDEDAFKWCFFSPLYKVMPTAVQCEVIWFQNNYGHFEQVTFVRAEDKFTVNSSSQFTPYNVSDPYNVSTVQADFRVGHKRYNIRSNDTMELTALFPEPLMPWLKELFRSPYVLQEIPTVSGNRFILNSNQLFRAVTVLDDTFTITKVVTEAGTKYQVTVKIIPAIDNINLRN